MAQALFDDPESSPNNTRSLSTVNQYPKGADSRLEEGAGTMLGPGFRNNKPRGCRGKGDTRQEVVDKVAERERIMDRESPGS